MNGLLGLSYEHTEGEEDEEEEGAPAGGGLVAYDHEEDENGDDEDSINDKKNHGGQGDEERTATSPHKRRRLDEGAAEEELQQNGATTRQGDEEEEAAMARRQRAVEELERQYRQQQQEMDENEAEAEEESDQHHLEERRAADFEDQSSYIADGRSLMDSMLPPRPARPPDASLQGKIVQFHRLRREGRAKSINEKIRHARNFKNPYMLNWLVSHCGIDETGSNYPKELFDPAAIRREAAEVMERQRRQKAGQQKATGPAAQPSLLPLPGALPSAGIAAGLGMPRPVVKVVEGKKRPARSKWDQGEPAAPGSKTGSAAPSLPAAATTTTGSRYAEYALAKKAEIEARLRQK